MGIHMKNAKKENEVSKLKKNITKKYLYMNQLDTLIDLAERLQNEMDNADLSREDINNILDINDEYYLMGILEAMENPTLRQISDLFSVFHKIIALVPLGKGEKVQIVSNNKLQKNIVKIPAGIKTEYDELIISGVSNNKVSIIQSVELISSSALDCKENSGLSNFQFSINPNMEYIK